MTYDLEHLGRQVDKLSDAIEENTNEKGENGMNDIAGLLALMQGNKGMDLPGLLALCKEKGYDRGWGGEGMFLFVFLILFLFAGNGWNGLNRNQQQDFAAMAGNNCQSIIGLHDRISAAQAVSTNGFTQLQTWLCESIANARAAMECRILQSQKDCCCEMNQRFDRLECTINTNRLADENARLTRENEALKDTIRGDRIADAAIQRLENFTIQHYKVTNVPSGASA